MKVAFLIKRAAPFVLAAAIVLAAVCYPQKETSEEARRVVRVWNVDTFEGGKGSRTSFLKSAARRVEKERGGVSYLVTSRTAEGALAALAEGDVPDVLSFGVGLNAFAEYALPLPVASAGGSLGGETLAVPWARGGYALFSRGGFDREGKTAISCGGSNLPAVAAALAKIEGEELPALTAYTRFLNGEFDFLLGTQRDLCRFASRSVAVEYRPLPAYSDLFQYLSVLSAEKREDGLALLSELLSDRSQAALSSLGLYPVKGEDPFAPLPQRTACVFLSETALCEAERLARAGEIKNLGKYLKSIEIGGNL